MSRTYRRVKARYNHDNVLRVNVWSGPYRWSFTKVRMSEKSPEGKRALAHYHSDAGFGDYRHACPPHWYRHFLNRRADRREEREVQRWWRDPQHEVLLPRRVREARWYW